MSIVKIAAGVFLGLTAFTIMAGGIALLTMKEVAEQSAAQFNRAMEDMRVDNELARITAEEQRRNAQAHSQAAMAYERNRQQRVEQARALAPDERCAQGIRLKRIDNGWQQVGSC